MLKDTSKTVVINFFAGPGTGKSTCASRLFAELKDLGISCENVEEYAERKTWEGSVGLLQDQFLVSAKQRHAILMSAQSCDIVITDSPILLGAAFASQLDLAAGLVDTLSKYTQQFCNFNILLQRGDRPYDPNGRNQTYEEACKLDTKIVNVLEALYSGELYDAWGFSESCGCSLCIDMSKGSKLAVMKILTALRKRSIIPEVPVPDVRRKEMERIAARVGGRASQIFSNW